MEKIVYNLISLKCVLFLFLGGLGCLFPFLPLHMLEKGLTEHEARIISIISPCIALIGPIIVGALADRLAGSGNFANGKSKFGKYFRIIIAVVVVAAAIFYLLLLVVPSTVRLPTRRPLVSFTSDPTGGVILQERCTEERTCHRWATEKEGALLLTNCRYACHTPPTSRNGTDDLTTTDYPDDEINEPTDVSEDENYEEDEDEGTTTAEMNENEEEGNVKKKKKRETTIPSLIEPPHLCYRDKVKQIDICQVYTDDTKNISIDVSLDNTDDDDDDWCHYKLRGYFAGRISRALAEQLIDPDNNSCRPVIQCDVDDPYDSPNSVLAESECVQALGDPALTFWMYLVIRCVADVFPTTALVLLDAAIIIATRETSSGRGDVGRQLAWGTLGFASFAPLIGYLTEYVMPKGSGYAIAIIMFAVFMVITALVVLFASDMPLSPPEWWWHTKCGMLALPMSSIRHFRIETGALIFVLFLLGVFWSALDSYLPWHLSGAGGSLIGLTITVGALPALPFLWYAERIVDYCGHTNILITSFVFYIVRYTGMGLFEDAWWVLLTEAFEVFTLILMWVTAVLYLRHLIPRRITVTGQALPVIAHFCLGRSLGAIIGDVVPQSESIRYIYPYMAIAAAAIATLYFCAYHLYIRPRYAAVMLNGTPRSPPTIMQTMNGNGSYTPLRIYHNGRARKGQFRY